MGPAGVVRSRALQQGVFAGIVRVHDAGQDLCLLFAYPDYRSFVACQRYNDFPPCAALSAVESSALCDLVGVAGCWCIIP
mmetsp:Transcript_43483/g.94715  ORF Transcript_43483/g.94715 Transcript_43483/m.94715 type:complete len:80 (-) Transcript_43483:8-247(-)